MKTIIHPTDWGKRHWFENQLKRANENEAAAYFSHDINGYQRFRHQFLTQYLTKNLRAPIHSLLDIGCGTGSLTEHIKNELKIENVCGTDFVPALLEIGRRQYPDIEFLDGELPDLNVKEKKFDLITASEVLYYLSPDKQSKTISNIVDRLNPEGVFLYTARLGSGYASQQQVVSLLSPYFKNLRFSWMHNRFYHHLSFPARAFLVVNDKGFEQQVSLDTKHGYFINRHQKILSWQVTKMIIKIGALIADPLIRSDRIVSICHHFAKFLRQNPTNIIVLASNS